MIDINLQDNRSTMNANVIDSDPTNFKVCIIGEESVGKTALLNRYITGSFVSTYKPTIAASFMSAHEIVGDHTVTLNIWDTAGQEKYQSMMPLYLRNVDCVVLVLDVIKPSSWKYVEKWIENELPTIQPTPIIIVCANKCDLEPAYNLQLVEEEMKNKDIHFYFTSSMSGQNIAAVFNQVAQSLDEETVKKKKIRPSKLKEQKKGSCC